jgi:hypothetical protein
MATSARIAADSLGISVFDTAHRFLKRQFVVSPHRYHALRGKGALDA